MSDVNEIIQLLGLEDFLTKKITQLSGEQRAESGCGPDNDHKAKGSSFRCSF